jgi:hypothetical protein
MTFEDPCIQDIRTFPFDDITLDGKILISLTSGAPLTWKNGFRRQAARWPGVAGFYGYYDVILVVTPRGLEDAVRDFEARLAEFNEAFRLVYADELALNDGIDRAIRQLRSPDDK